MPCYTIQNPKYRRHKPSGRAVVTLEGRDYYLGPYGPRASRDEYDRLISEWWAGGRRLGGTDLTVVELIGAFRKHAAVYYRRPDGSPTSEAAVYRHALKPLRRLYGRTAAEDFGPLALKAVAAEMVRLGWCGNTVNKHLGRVKHVFKWAAANEMVPATVFHALQAVPGFRAGRSAARASDPVGPVPPAYVEAALPHVSPQVAAMVRLQLLTGMRPGEACAMRSCDVDTSGRLWTYRPPRHKTEHRGHDRVVYLGPKAQGVLGPFLKPDLQACVFSPAEAEAARRAARHAARTTPPSHGNVPGSNRKRRPQRRVGGGYDVAAYRRAIARACDKAFPPPEDLAKELPPDKAREKIAEWRSEHRWHPHQLRHNAATALRKEYGLEAAQVILGHRTLAVTEIYAEKNVEAAQRIMAEVG